MERRLKIATLFFPLAFLLLIARLFYWQGVKGSDLLKEAKRQHRTSQELSAPRGNILAKDASFLAGRADSYTVFAFLPEVEEEKSVIADRLSPFLVEEGEDYQKRLLEEAGRLKSLLSRDDLSWVPLVRRVGTEEKKALEALNLAGIGFELEEARVYPEASAAAHLLGFVGKDSEGKDQGYFGLEGYYDLTLSGKPGFLARERDARGSPIVIGDSQEVTAIEGVSLITHIDKSIQLVVEEELAKGIEKYGAKAGSAVVMDPMTGAVLASASQPSYDPGSYAEYGDGFFKDPLVADTFEPGSVFKVLIMAAALNEGVVEPTTKCEICGGPFKIDKYHIRTWNNEYRPDSTMIDVIVHSDNVGMAFVGGRLGIEKLYEYLTKFGLGEKSGIDLQGEVTPALRPLRDWNVVDLAVASFGQGVAITPIQLVKAVSAIANGGYLVTPQVVDKLVGEGWQEDIKPEKGPKILDADSVQQVKEMMVEAAKKGEAQWTHIRGFEVAGKTGTAQIPIAGHYDDEKTIASFIGFAPADDPKFIMLVTLREPQSSPWASETAAPLWYTIAKDLFLHFGISPSN